MNERDMSRYGFIVLRQIHDEQLVASLQDCIVKQMSELNAFSGFTDQGQPLFDSPSDDVTAWLSDLPELAAMEHLEFLAQSNDVINVIGELLSTDTVFVHPNKVVRNVPPSERESNPTTHVHQDYPEIQGSLGCLTLWSPLFPVTPATGSLPVYPISNTMTNPRIAPLTLSAGSRSGWSIDPSWLPAKPRCFNLQPGDALLFSATTPHGGARNTGRGWRVSVESRYQSLRDPIAETNLQCFTSETWDEHYASWSAYANYWRSAHPPVVPFDLTWEAWRDLEAVSKAGIEAQRALELAADQSNSPTLRNLAAGMLTTSHRD